MSKLRLLRPRKMLVSVWLHALLNILLAVLVTVTAVSFQPAYLAYGLVFLSKWRVLAVRPRYWWANIQANTLDILVGISTVMAISNAAGETRVQVVFGFAYAVWLVFIKPGSSPRMMTAQALIAQLGALMALFSVAYTLPSSVVVIAAYVIGYIAARHFLSAFDEEHMAFLAMCWALFLAGMSWITFHMTLASNIFGPLSLGRSTFLVPHIALIVSAVGYIVARIYMAPNEESRSIKGWDSWASLILAALTIVFLLGLALLGLFDASTLT